MVNYRGFYVQDERYVAVPWMAKSVYVQDERYVAVPWMAKSVYVQDERVVFCSCKNYTSTIPGGRMLRCHDAAWIMQFIRQCRSLLS